MPRHDPNILDRALGAACAHINENDPCLMERHRLVSCVARDLRVAIKTARAYIDRVIDEGHLILITAEPGQPIRVATDQREAFVWVGDIRPYAKNALHYRVTGVLPKAGPKKSVTFVLTPRQLTEIVEDHSI